jgi:8-oxo-dGTP diphosphatase
MPGRDHASLQLAVDLAILTVRDGRLQALIIERANDPYRGMPALPGGFLRDGEDLQEAAARELGEETGLGGAGLHLEQLAAYGASGRDPRGRVVSVAYLAIAPDLPVPTAGSDARSARWSPAGELRGMLAFDHGAILGDAVERARARLEATPLAAAFCGDEFTVGDLRQVYEAVWGTVLDPRNFSRKVLHAAGFIEPTGGTRAPGTGRPAALYRRGPAQALHPPILRGAEDRAANGGAPAAAGGQRGR